MYTYMAHVAFLVVVAGAHIGVWGVATNVRCEKTVDAVPLTPLLPCYYHPGNSSAFMSLARVLVALCNAVHSAIKDDACISHQPDISHLGGLPVTDIRRLYKKRLLFSATIGGETWAVKLVRNTYGELAHRKAADVGLAPRLLTVENIGGTSHCTCVPSPQKQMVVLCR
jgi:hypothetical protein